METQDLHFHEIEFKWQADLKIDRLEFYFYVFEKALNEEYFDNGEITNEEEYNIIKTRIEQHLISAYVYLFQSDCYGRFWVLPSHLREMVHINEELPQLSFINHTKSLLLKNDGELSKDEKMFFLLYKTMFCLGLLNKFKQGKFNENFRSDQLILNKDFLNQVNLKIRSNYDSLKDGEEQNENKSNNRWAINFINPEAKKIAIEFFNKLNSDEVFNYCIFEDNQTFDYFMDSLVQGELNENVIYRFNTNNSKGLMVQVFNLAKDLFKSTNVGPIAFIKNSKLFYFKNKLVNETNWTSGSTNLTQSENDYFLNAQNVLLRLKSKN